jgi:hypothetical protein
VTTHNATHPTPHPGQDPDRRPTPPPNPVRPGLAGTPPGTVSPSGRRVAAWMGWHVLELTGVSVPLALAVTTNGWWAVLAGAVGAGWAGHEVQLARRHRTLRPTTPHNPQLTSTTTPSNPAGAAGKDQNDD